MLTSMGLLLLGSAVLVRKEYVAALIVFCLVILNGVLWQLGVEAL